MSGVASHITGTPDPKALAACMSILSWGQGASEREGWA